ncbi:MAG: ComEA family DNA-binding protein [Ruminococcus sp.]
MKKKNNYINTQKFTVVVGIIFTVVILIVNNFTDFTPSTLRSEDVSKTETVVQSTTIPEIININTADASLLAELDLIGDFKAKKIVEYRRKYGKFKSIEDIMNVPGIGEKTFEINKHRLTVK